MGAIGPDDWKPPKLRIPDIYENRESQLALGRFGARERNREAMAKFGTGAVEAVTRRL